MFPVLLFAKAMVAGFVIALPVGAIGAMCMRRAFSGRWIDSMVTGAGAAVADSAMAAAALIGLSLVKDQLLAFPDTVRIVGGVFLVAIGVRMIRARRPNVPDTSASEQNQALWRTWFLDFFTGLALTLINPATILGFVGVFAGLGLLKSDAFGDLDIRLASTIVVAGAFLGSMLWWTLLTITASAMRHHVPERVVPAVNAFFGAVVFACGVFALLVGLRVLPASDLGGLL